MAKLKLEKLVEGIKEVSKKVNEKTIFYAGTLAALSSYILLLNYITSDAHIYQEFFK